MKAKSWAALLSVLIIVSAAGCCCGRYAPPGCKRAFIIDQLPSLADWLDMHGPLGCQPLLRPRPQPSSTAPCPP